MLFIYDVHQIMGEREFDFEDAVRYEYAPAVAAGGARLLCYLHATHGAGAAYNIVTVTAVADGRAWERLDDRLRRGDLAPWRAQVDAMRYGSHSSLVVQVPWSPLGAVDLDAVPAELTDTGASSVFREDTHTGRDVVAAVTLGRSDDTDVVQAVAAFAPALGGDDSVRILYRLQRPDEWFDRSRDAGDWSGAASIAEPDSVASTSRMLRSVEWSPWR